MFFKHLGNSSVMLRIAYTKKDDAFARLIKSQSLEEVIDLRSEII